MARYGPRAYTHLRCRKAVGIEKPCKGTQVRAFDIEEAVWSALMNPAKAFPRRRGRPGKDVLTLYALCQVIPLLEPRSERVLIRNVVQEVVWNAETRGIRIMLNWEALASGLDELLPNPEKVRPAWDE